MGKEYIAMCCETPLVETCIFSGLEFYCLKCQRSYGILGDFETVESSRDLVIEKEENRKRFETALASKKGLGV